MNNGDRSPEQTTLTQYQVRVCNETAYFQKLKSRRRSRDRLRPTEVLSANHMEGSNQAHSRKRGVDPNAPNGDREERKLDSSHNTDDPVTPSPRGSNKNRFDSDDPNSDFEERISPR